ncbi:cation:proton antiporter [Microvirga makkahensis]|uniref:Sodium:proton antiporter n=1 Tax=Microvirga makkahensis TaxID=1128670 RepID=A0A7X3MRL6_9HYPH|nr:cation:proton antiporter [Microvirga makkahensis]MXQ11951.1 sodium:proton antiporter [Microvirga makkahensis]
MSANVVLLAGFGVVVLLTAWLPMVLKELPLSLPIFCVGLGALVFAIPGLPGVLPHPMEELALVEHVSELVVIISLMGAGLKIDRPFGWGRWGLTWRLLGISMPLTVLGLAWFGYSLLGLSVASAVLLAGALAPTDPVLASDVQVGPPGGGQEDEVRFTLTSEAGLNDGLAFPFILLALSLVQGISMESLAGWLAYAVLWKIGAGIAMGYGIGRLLGWLTFHLPNRAKLSRTGSGFVALGITCLAYGATEMVKGYGFLAVFVAALALRATKREDAYHEKLHDFAEELERLLMMALLVLLGGAMTAGQLFRAMSWEVAAFGLLALFVIRPLAGWVGLIGTKRPPGEKMAISFFGIRGLGSIYYLAYGLHHREFDHADVLWSTAGFIVLVSIVLHGVTVTPVMRHLDRRRNSAAGA